MSRINLSKVFSTTLICTFLFSNSAFAELEEIIVTAQKREQSLQDVPISISVVSGEVIRDAGLDNIEDLQAYVPNLQMSETGISTQLYVRGIGTGNNQGFEQSVGQYIDGIYYGRQQLIRAPFFDMDRIEVLRGPQGTLFGKNTIAGALNMTTAKPTEELGGYISIEGGEFSLLDGRFALSGALNSDGSLRGRIAGRYFETDGYIRNDFRDRDETEREESAIRFSLEHDVNDQFSYGAKLELNNFDTVGRAIEVIQDDPAIAPFPLAGFTFDEIFALVLTDQDAIGDTSLDGVRSANAREDSQNELINATFEGRYDLANGSSLEFTTGYVEYEIEERCDCDFIAGDIFDTLGEEEYDQFSQEIRLVSPGGEKFDWLAGVFYQTSTLDYQDQIRIPATSILPAVNPQLAAISNTSAFRNYDADSDLFAVFAQGTWSFSDTFRATLGARFTTEDKDASRVLNVIDLATGQIPSDPTAAATAAAVYAGAFAVQTEQLLLLGSPTGHNLNGDLSEDAFTPSISIEWDATDNVLVYGSISSGFKAGGFDARANNIGSFEFGEEEAVAFEAGFKSTLLNGNLELNGAIYFTDYDDLQIAQFDGTLGFNVGNAASTEVSGFEIDGRWFISDAFTVNYSLGYLDHSYEDYQNGNCFNRQVPDGVLGAQGNQLCDYTGRDAQYTPEITSSVALNYEQELGASGMRVKGLIAYNYTDEQNVHVNIDPLYNIDSVGLIDISIGLESDNWSVALLGQNVSDEDYVTYVGNTPLSGSSFGTNTFYGFVAPPQTFSVRGEYRF